MFLVTQMIKVTNKKHLFLSFKYNFKNPRAYILRCKMQPIVILLIKN